MKIHPCWWRSIHVDEDQSMLTKTNPCWTDTNRHACMGTGRPESRRAWAQVDLGRAVHGHESTWIEVCKGTSRRESRCAKAQDDLSRGVRMHFWHRINIKVPFTVDMTLHFSNEPPLEFSVTSNLLLTFQLHFPVITLTNKLNSTHYSYSHSSYSFSTQLLPHTHLLPLSSHSTQHNSFHFTPLQHTLSHHPNHTPVSF